MRVFYDIDLLTGGGEDLEKSALAPALATIRTGNVGSITAPMPSTVAPLPINKSLLAKPNIIPAPNYNDAVSRQNYLKQWQSKYGSLEGRGDTVLKVNEVPRAASGNAKDISKKAAEKYGIDPALLYSSAMEEGMSGLFKDKSGIDTKHRKPTDFGYQDFYGDKDYPVNGDWSFGINTFSDRFPDLVKAGYLDKDFAKNFRGSGYSGEYNKNDFKTADAALQAKAAMLKYHYDDVDSYAAHRGIKLSPKARDFFALAEYNGGEGTGHQMMNDYHVNGHLEGDKFMEARPTTGKGLKPESYKTVYDNVKRRLKMREGLKAEQLFD